MDHPLHMDVSQPSSTDTVTPVLCSARLPCVASAELTKKGSDSLNSQKKHSLDHGDSPE